MIKYTTNNNNSGACGVDQAEEEEEGDGEKEDIILKYSGPMRRSIATYNLVVSSDLILDDNNNSDQYEIVAESLPSLTQLNEFIPSMTKTIDTIISTKQSKQLQELFPA